MRAEPSRGGGGGGGGGGAEPEAAEGGGQAAAPEVPALGEVRKGTRWLVPGEILGLRSIITRQPVSEAVVVPPAAGEGGGGGGGSGGGGGGGGGSGGGGGGGGGGSEGEGALLLSVSTDKPGGAFYEPSGTFRNLLEASR